MVTHVIDKEENKNTEETFWPIMIAVFFGAFIAVLNTSMINIAIPSLISDFDSNIGTIQWTLTGFMLATGLSAPLSGYLGDRFGSRNLYVYVLIGLGLSSLLCALAWNPLSLILFRIVQGFFCGVIMPVTMTLIYQAFKSEHHAFAISLWSVAAWMGPAFGPTIAGLVLNYTSWPWLFILNIPLVLISVILAIKLIPSSNVKIKSSLDISGLILVLYCSFALLLFFSEGVNWGLLNWKTLIIVSTGLLTLILFVKREVSTPEPLLNLRVFKEKRFTISVIISCITTASLFAGVYLIPIFMQMVQGASPLKTGLVLLPASLIMVIIMPLIGKMYHSVGPLLLTLIGLCIIAISQWMLHLLTSDINSGYILLWMMVRNIGLAFASAPVTNAGMEVISKELYGHASAVNNWARQMVSSFAIGVFTVLYAVRQTVHLERIEENGSKVNAQVISMTEGINDVFLISTIIVIIGIPVALGLKGNRPIV